MQAFRKRGLGVAALSYDFTAILEHFATRRGITYPLLADPDSSIIRRFGVLDPSYPEGSLAHGVPYPVAFVADARGVVREKHLAEKYVFRRTAASLLVLEGERPEAGAREVGADHFALRLSASNAAAAPGQRITLVLDFEMKDKHHAYAPGASGYRPLAVRLEPNPLATAGETRFPEASAYFFAPLEETVPVFEGRFRLLQDVTLAPIGPLKELLERPGPAVTLKGALDYQVCSDKVCYPPSTLPLVWVIQVEKPDLQRVPEALRRKPRP